MPANNTESSAFKSLEHCNKLYQAESKGSIWSGDPTAFVLNKVMYKLAQYPSILVEHQYSLKVSNA